MGLDNGILIKGKTLKGKFFLKEHFDNLKTYGNSYEIAYWRKCWNIRDKFLEVFSDKDYDRQGGEIHLDVEELYDVVEHILKYFLIEDNWIEGNGFVIGSIWTWEEQLRNIADIIYNIRKFLELYKEAGLDNNDFDIIFYDSY